jgi:hypothetical protein
MAQTSPGPAIKALCKTSQLLAQTRDLGHQEVYALWHLPPARIAPFKYKSPRRHDQLSACARLLATAQALFPQSPEPLLAWQAQLVGFHHVTAWDFFTPSTVSPLQHSIPPPRPYAPTIAPQRPVQPWSNDTHAPRPPPPGLLEV